MSLFERKTQLLSASWGLAAEGPLAFAFRRLRSALLLACGADCGAEAGLRIKLWW